MKSNNAISEQGQTTVGVKLDASMLVEIDAFASRSVRPLNRFQAVRALLMLGLEVDRQKRSGDRKTAAQSLKEERARATAEYAAAQTAEENKTELLRKLRLARDAASHNPDIASDKRLT